MAILEDLKVVARQAELSFGSGSTATSAKFTVNPSIVPSHLFLGIFPETGQPAPRILAGLSLFRLLEVLNDARNELVGLTRR